MAFSTKAPKETKVKMTLVLSYISRDFIIQVSDRRFTTPDGTNPEQGNKAIALGWHISFAYTGFRDLFSDIAKTDLKTERWLETTLTFACQKYPYKSDDEDWLWNILSFVATKADLALERLHQKYRNQVPFYGHAFIGVAWDGLENPASQLHPVIVKISNFHDTDGRRLNTTYPEFKITRRYLADDEPCHLDFTGIAMAEQMQKRINSVLKTMHKRNKGALEVTNYLINIIHSVAKKTSSVSTDLMGVYYPKNGVRQQASGNLQPGGDSVATADLLPQGAMVGATFYNPASGGWVFANTLPGGDAVSYFHQPEGETDFRLESPLFVDPSGFSGKMTVNPASLIDLSTMPVDNRPLYESCQATVLSDWQEMYDAHSGSIRRYPMLQDHYKEHEMMDISMGQDWKADEACPYYGVVLCVKLPDADLEKLYLDARYFVITSPKNAPLQIPSAAWIQELQSWLEQRGLPKGELNLFIKMIQVYQRKDILDRLRLMMATRRDILSTQFKEIDGH
jgi:hypothetical protein